MSERATVAGRRGHDSTLERLDREALGQLQLARLQPLLAEVLAHNPFWRERFAGVGLTDAREIRTREDFRRLPFTTKFDLAADQEAHPPFGTNLTYPPERYVRLLRTSGTTGRPLRWLETDESLAWGARAWVASFRAAGVGPGDRIFFAFSFGPFLAYWGAWEGARLLGALAISGGAQNSVERLHALLDNEATVLACTPTYTLRLAEVAAQQGLDIRGSAIRRTIHGGEPGACIPSTKRRIEEVWGALCCDTSGSTETGHWGFECLESRCDLHVEESEYLAEIVDPETLQPVAPGTPGELVLTNFGRWGMPIFRYRTRDRVIATEDRCACGRTFMRLQGGVLGRTDDMLVVRGVNVFPSAIENIVRQHGAVVEYQIEVQRQRGMSELLLRLELDGGVASEEARAALLGQVLEAIHRGLHLRLEGEVVPLGSLPRYELKARRVVVRAD